MTASDYLIPRPLTWLSNLVDRDDYFLFQIEKSADLAVVVTDGQTDLFVRVDSDGSFYGVENTVDKVSDDVQMGDAWGFLYLLIMFV